MDNQEGALNFDQANLSGAVEQAAHKFNFVFDGLLPSVAILIFILVCLFSVLKSLNDKNTLFDKFPKISSWPVVLKISLFVLVFSYALVHAFSAGSVFYMTQIANQGSDSYFRDLGVGRLLSLSHAHLFAHATMYFLLALLVQFAEGPRFILRAAPLISLWGGVFDVFSWWGTKKLSPSFEYLSALSGSSFSLGFILIAFVLFKNLLSSATSKGLK